MEEDILKDVLYSGRTYYNPRINRYHFQDIQNDIPNSINNDYKGICGEPKKNIYEYDPYYLTPVGYRNSPPVCYNQNGLFKERCIGKGKSTFDLSTIKTCPVPTVLKNPILYQYEKSGNPPGGLQVGPQPVYQEVENVWNNFTKRKLL